jgi:glucokinase
MSTNRVIGVDLGGTKILAGVVERDGTVLRHREIPTPLDSQEALLDGLEAAVTALQDESIAAVGFGIPTRVEQETGRIVGESVNIPLKGMSFRSVMSERLGLPVAIENDANAAALAEHVAGVARGVSRMVMLTLGTGVGGGVIFDGRLFRGWAEFGHLVVEFDGEPCAGVCTGRGHMEAYVSGTAATRRAREAFGGAVDAHRLVRIAEEGDAQAIQILDDIGRRLGAGIGSLINIFNPDIVVIGGGFAAAGDLILEPARAVARREALHPAEEHVKIVRAELGTMAGLIGAGLVAFEAIA